MDVRRYAVKHLIDGKIPAYSDSWEDKGHTITVITPSSSNDTSRDDLFFDHNHVHPKNWKWIHKRRELAFAHDTRENFLGGHVGFSDDSREGSGSLQLGRTAKLGSVRLSYMHPTYSCDLSTNAGAYVVKEGLTLKWDTTSAAWRNATWSENAMKFTYWVEKDGKVGDQQLYQTGTVFTRGTETWDVLPRGPGGSGAATTILDANRQFSFTLNTGYKPKSDAFPYKMAFQFDQLAQSIEGGAMLSGRDDVQGKVYAMKGQIDNSFAVGSYKMVSPSGAQSPFTINVHGGKLIDSRGVPVATSHMYGSSLRWDGLNEVELPHRGHVEFSPDGTRITSSSFGDEGYRQVSRLYGSSSDLSLITLLNMNPNGTDGDGNSVEIVQRESMTDFYKIIQYYMPTDLLHTFIAAEVPDLGDIKDIADDNKSNEKFYSDLAIPYLTNALKSADRDSVKKLNARRAQAVLKQRTSVADVYKEQSARLYTHEWVKKFPEMLRFLEDQRNNTAQQHNAVNQEADNWIANIRKGMDHVDKDERKQLQQMIDIAENARARGLDSLYWAFLFFRYLCSEGYLTMLRMQMIDGNTSQVVTQNIQRYSSILSVLDSSTYFTKEFIQVMQVQQLTALLPSFMQPGNNLEETTFFMELLIEKFLKKYVDSPDPAIQKRVQEVEEALQKHSIQEFMQVLSSVSLVGSHAWNSIAQRFTKAIVVKFGKAFKGMAEMMVSMVTALAIVQLCTGMIKWSDLTVTQQASFVVGCFSIVTTLIRKGIEAAVAYESTGSLWEAFKVFLYKDIEVYQESITSFLGRWVTNNVERLAPKSPEDLRGLFFEDTGIAEDYPRFTRIMGNSLDEFMATRFAAAMAIVGIVLSAIGLADSSTPLEKAMNSMFLVSGILDLAAAAAEWAIAAGIEEIGGLAIASISSLAGPLAIVAAVIGVIIMLVIMFTAKKPPNPVDEFVDRADVKSAGFYMEYEASIEYFQVISDNDHKPRDIGVAFKPKTLAVYLVVNSDGSLSCGPLSHGYDTVLSISTDYQGQSYILTQIWRKRDGSDGFIRDVVALTLNDNGQLSMAGPISDDKQKNKQLWIATCVGDVTYESTNHLKSASFTIENVHSKGKYLSVSSTAVTVATSATTWTLSMEPMKPAHLIFHNINLYTLDKDRVFYPDLGQVGSISNQHWSVTPSLPDFMMFDNTKGTVSQRKGQAPPVYSSHSFTIQVTNDYGSANAEFTIAVSSI